MKIKKIIFQQINYPTAPHPDDFADMLRYDLAFVHGDQPGIVMFPAFQTPAGTLGGKVTDARWRSFCIRLETVEREFDSTQAEQWFTYRFARKGEHGQMDYTRLEKLTLKRAMEMKWTEL